jgi:ABC-type uncharacterized transport system permease subunit
MGSFLFPGKAIILNVIFLVFLFPSKFGSKFNYSGSHPHSDEITFKQGLETY